MGSLPRNPGAPTLGGNTTHRSCRDVSGFVAPVSITCIHGTAFAAGPARTPMPAVAGIPDNSPYEELTPTNA
jgi:hypothetical protein